MKLSARNGLDEEVYQCTNRDGIELRGIVHRPATGNGRGLLLLPAGMKYRVGAHGFYIWLARQLVRDGYTVLRVDTTGIGYSEGIPYRGRVQEVWRRVEQGALVDDALELARHFRQGFRLQSVIAGGICGAAVTAQLAAAIEPGLVDGVLAINASIGLSAPGPERNMHPDYVSHNVRRYLRKLFSGFAWNRLLRGESDFSGIISCARIFLRNCLPLNARERGWSVPDQVNEKFISSYRIIQMNGIKVLYLFGGGDRHWTDFKSVFLKYHLNGKTQGEHHTVDVIPEANHELYLDEWQQAALASIRDWLHRTMNMADFRNGAGSGI